MEKELLNSILMQAFDDMIFVMKVEEEMNFTYRFINQSAKKKLSIDDHYLGSTIDDTFNPVHAAFLNKQFRHALKTASSVEFTDAFMSSSKEMRYTKTKLQPFFNEDGVCTHIVSLVSKADNLIQWQKELKKREKHFRSVAKYSRDLMSILDAEGRIIFASPSHETKLGYKVAECEGEKLKDFLHPDDLPIIQNKMTKSIDQGKALFATLRLLRKDHTAISFEFNGTPIFNNDGSFKNIVVIGHDISEQEKHQEMEYLAYHDFLTKIPNRRKFNIEWDKALKDWHEERSQFAVLLFDIDNFKKINDNWGHDIGDIILIEIAQRLVKNLCAKDTAARLGGDEFAIIIKDIRTYQQVNAMARSIQSLLDDQWEILPRNLPVYTSMGISWSGLYDEKSIDSIVKDADIALYKAKKRKGNTINSHES